MKRILFLIFIFFVTSFICKSQIAVISYTSVAVGGIGGSTPPIVTTSANGIVVGLNYYQSSGRNISDNKGNTYTFIRNEQVGSGAYAAVAVYYCANPTVGTNHIFSTTSTFANIFVISISGLRTACTSLDQQNGAQANTSSVATGSITPSANDCFIFAAYGAFNPGGSPTISSGGTGFNLIGAYSTSTSEAGRADYKIQTSASSENLTYQSASSPHSTAIVVSFFSSLTSCSPTYNSGWFLISN